MKYWLAFALALAASTGHADDLKPFMRGSWQTLRQEHQGQPVIVHFWGVTCAPCLAELPQWGRLLRDQPNVKLILIEADLVAESPSRVTQILSKAGLPKAESWAFADSFEDRVRYEIDPSWQGELPRTMMIAGDGKIETLTGDGNVQIARAWAEKHR